MEYTEKGAEKERHLVTKRYGTHELNTIYARIAGVGLRPGLWVPSGLVRGSPAPGPAMEVYLRYSDVVPRAAQPEALYRDLLQQVPVMNAVGVLAAINNLLATGGRDPQVHRGLNERFLRNDLRQAVANLALGGGAFPVVFTPTGCFHLMRHLILYGGNPTGSATTSEDALGDLMLLGNEFLQSDFAPKSSPPSAVEIALQFVPTWDVDNPRDLGYALGRMYTILGELLPGVDPGVRNRFSAIGVRSGELAVDGLPLDDFMAVVFGIYSWAQDILTKGPQVAVFDHKLLFEKVGFPQALVEKFVAKRGLDLSGLKDQLGRGIVGGREDFKSEMARRAFLTESLNVFRQNPLLRLDNGRTLILGIQFLAELLTSGVYWSIFDGLPQASRKTFKELWGRLFELYCTGLLSEFYPPSSGVMSSDVPCVGGQIDALLDFGDDVFVFEIKSSLLTEAAKRKRNLDEFEKDVILKFVRNEKGNPKAILQLVRACKAIANQRVRTAVHPKAPRRIYPIFVSDEPAVEALFFNQYLDELFQRELGKSPSTRPLTTMSVNEFEETLPYTSSNLLAWNELLEERFKGGIADIFSVHQTIYNLRTARRIAPPAE
jgi:hypothetical protein